MMPLNLSIETLCEWSQASELVTKRGVRLLRKAKPTPAFWNAWRQAKDEFKSAGVVVGKTNTGEWEVCWWQPLSPDELARRREVANASRETSSNLHVPVPDGLKFRPYQLAGIAYCQNAFMRVGGALIADEMGLGKTVQAIGLINLNSDIQDVLIVCPASLKWNWKSELDRWLARPMDVQILSAGDGLTRGGVRIINYDIVHKYHEQLRSKPWDMLICDEAHYLKDPKTRRTQHVLGGETIPPIPAVRRLFLTGTPILNRPIELWPILHAIDPDRWRSWYAYVKRYCNYTCTRFGADVSGASNLEELQCMLRESVMVRRLKADVLSELPPKIRQIIVIHSNDLDPFVREELDIWEQSRAEVDAAKRMVNDAKKGNDKDAYREAVKQLRQCASVAFTKISAARHKLAVAKCPAVIEHVEQELESVNKLVVFGHHHDVLAAIADYFGDRAVRVWGEIPLEERSVNVERFNNDASVRVLVGGIRSAGFGLNLQCAQEAVFAELDWTPAVMSQCEDRLHRLGQHDTVLIKHLVVDGSLDARVAVQLVQKQQVLEHALGDSSADEMVVP